MHGVLNIDKNKNYSLIEIDETNLLSLVSPWLDNNYHKQMKVLQCHEIFPLRQGLVYF